MSPENNFLDESTRPDLDQIAMSLEPSIGGRGELRRSQTKKLLAIQSDEKIGFFNRLFNRILDSSAID